MSLRINHNLAALNANRNLNETNSALSKSMQRLSSGYRINQGADDPAGLVISEQFRAQIAGLNRAIGNSEGSINMIQTAEGALTETKTFSITTYLSNSSLPSEWFPIPGFVGAVDVGPDGLIFNKPVKITIPLNTPSIPYHLPKREGGTNSAVIAP